MFEPLSRSENCPRRPTRIGVGSACPTLRTAGVFAPQSVTVRNNKLFTFVTFESATSANCKTHPASGTNHKSERQLRAPAQFRDTGRTSATAAGCRRKSGITSVLSSLSCYLREYTSEAIIGEVESWTGQGDSRFERLAKIAQLRPPR